jgi:type I restriction enzyme M protein
MNMILHGIEAPNIIHTNTLAENLADIQDKDRYDVILANPPFGGKERKEVQQNFPIKTGETAFLFLQHFIKMLKAGGRAAIVIKNTFLSQHRQRLGEPAQAAAGKLQPAHRAGLPRRHLPGRGREDRGAVLREGRADAQGLVLPARPRPQHGQDQPAQRRRPGRVRRTAEDLCRLAEELERGCGDHRQTTFDLSVKNPNGGEEVLLRSPQDIMDEIAALDAESAEVLGGA